jgi:hypothetical protein
VPRFVSGGYDAHKWSLEEIEKLVVDLHRRPPLRVLTLFSILLGYSARFAHSFRNARFSGAL